jgi:bacteriocin biosynthesis cyclodehydratase domain-containing protein
MESLESVPLKALRCLVVPVNGGIVLKRGRVELRVSGAEANEIVHAVLNLAGSRHMSQAEICSRFAAPDRDKVSELVQHLRERRFFVPVSDATTAPDDGESELEVFYWHLDAAPSDVTASMNRCRFAILGVNELSLRLATLLAACSVTTCSLVGVPTLDNPQYFTDDGQLDVTKWPTDLTPPVGFEEWSAATASGSSECLIGTSEAGGVPVIREWNKLCIARGWPFLPVLLRDLVAYIGPLTIPGETACYECVWARENAGLADPPTDRAGEDATVPGEGVIGSHPALTAATADIAAFEIIKFFGLQRVSRAPGTLIVLNLFAPRMDARPVLKVPRCPVCSPLNWRPPVALTLPPAPVAEESHDHY